MLTRLRWSDHVMRKKNRETSKKLLARPLGSWKR